jgi:hypothetical protein
MRYLFSLPALLLSITIYSQNASRPYRGGLVTNNYEELARNYEQFWKYLSVKKGEHVASIGAQNGYVEVCIATFVDGVHWCIQDIDTTYLNDKNFDKVLRYHSSLKGAPIDGDFAIVIGERDKTGLSRGFFDRVLMTNVYHELADRRSILLDIIGSLKPNGELVVMERMATKRGKKYGDCKLPQLWEPDFLEEMKSFNYKLVRKEVPDKKLPITFYTFNKII